MEAKEDMKGTVDLTDNRDRMRIIRRHLRFIRGPTRTSSAGTQNPGQRVSPPLNHQRTKKLPKDRHYISSISKSSVSGTHSTRLWELLRFTWLLYKALFTQ